jgi:hypothetical protein
MGSTGSGALGILVGDSFETKPPRPPTVADIAVIEAQLQEGVIDPETTQDFVGNFVANLPGGTYRQIVDTNSWLDAPVLTDKDRDADGDEYPHSERARSATWRQFFADVDQAIIDSGANAKELEQLNTALKNPEPGQRNTVHHDYNQAALPVYLKLLEMGYSPRDLWS